MVGIFYFFGSLFVEFGFKKKALTKNIKKSGKRMWKLLMKKTAGILVNAGRQVFLAVKSAKNYLFTVVYMKYL